MPKTNRRLLIGLLIGIFGVAFQAFGVLTAMPRAVAELGGMQLYAWAFSAFLIGMVMAIVIAGRVTDLMGPARPMVAGFALFTVGLVAAGFAPSIYVMVGARFVQGLGGGAMNLALFVLVTQLFDERQRSQLMAVLAFLWVLPAFLGPPTAGWIAAHWGWRWVFWSSLVPIIGCSVLALAPLLRLERVVPEVKPDSVPIWAGILIGVAATALQVAGQNLTWWAIPVALVGVIALCIAVSVIMPKGFARAARGLPAVVWVRALQSGTFFAAEPFLPLMLTNGPRRLELAQAGLVIALGSIGWTLGSAMQSRPWLKLRRDQIILLGASASVVGLAVVSAVAWLPHLLLVALTVGWVLTGFGMGLSQASTSLAVMGLSEPHRQGRNTSSLQVAEGMGSAIMTGVAGTAFAALHNLGHLHHSYAAVFTVLAFVAAPMVWLAMRVGNIPNAVAGR